MSELNSIISSAISRRVAIAGATGLVGHYLLQGLLADETVSEVHALCRRELTVKHPKLVVHLVDFSNLPVIPSVDELYLSIGTTIKQAGSQSAFRKIDLEANLAVAKMALSVGTKRIGLVSAAGASSRSNVFYNKIKGELEEALTAQAPESLLIVRPSLLLGDRTALGQKQRPAEKFAMNVFKLFGSIMPQSWRPVTALQVAKVLLAKLPSNQGKTVLSSTEIQTIGI